MKRKECEENNTMPSYRDTVFILFVQQYGPFSWPVSGSISEPLVVVGGSDTVNTSC